MALKIGLKPANPEIAATRISVFCEARKSSPSSPMRISISRWANRVSKSDTKVKSDNTTNLGLNSIANFANKDTFECAVIPII